MKRRHFIAGLGSSTVALPITAYAAVRGSPRFGAGIHGCVGQNIARAEGEALLAATAKNKDSSHGRSCLATKQ